MGRKKSTTNNNVIKIILPIICVIVVVVTFVLLFDMKNKTDNTANQNDVDTENIVENTNTNSNTNTNVVEENVVGENTVTNETKNNTVNNATSNETEQNPVVSNEDDILSTDKQEKAVELVKKHWGKDSSVVFTNEGARSNDEYTVAVRDKSTTEVKEYFKVNIKTGEVEVEY